MKYVITDGTGYLDYDGSFGEIGEAITFDHFQALAICNATGWDFEEEVSC
jgi:hypothetical protein